MWWLVSIVNPRNETDAPWESSDTRCTTVYRLVQAIGYHVGLLSSVAVTETEKEGLPGLLEEIISLIPDYNDPKNAGSTWEFILDHCQINIEHRNDDEDTTPEAPPLSFAELKNSIVRPSTHGTRYSAAVRRAVLDLHQLEKSQPGAIQMIEDFSHGLDK